jgi:secreted trypsin-like serine protease
MSNSNFSTIFSALLMSMFFCNTTDAIVIRHDRDDQRYQELAKQYSNSIVYLNGCVGTIIDPKWIITARHCFGNYQYEESLVLKRESFALEHSGKQYSIRKIFFNPKADMALIQLKRSIRNATPVSLYSSSDEQGEIATFVGNGGYGSGKVGLTKEDKVKRAANNIIEDVDQNWLTFDFDRPSQALELEGISGPGDSGGPAFIEENSQLYIAGISSWQDNDGIEGVYGVKEFYARISTNLNWINNIMAQPHHDLNLEILCKKFPLNSRCQNSQKRK